MKTKTNQYFIKYAVVTKDMSFVQQLIFKYISIYSLFKFEFKFYKSKIEWYRLITTLLVIIPYTILESEYYILLIPILYFDIIYMMMHPGIPIFTYEYDISKLYVEVDYEQLIIKVFVNKKLELIIKNIRLPITFVIIAIEHYLMGNIKNKKDQEQKLSFIRNHMTIESIPE